VGGIVGGGGKVGPGGTSPVGCQGVGKLGSIQGPGDFGVVRFDDIAFCCPSGREVDKAQGG